MGLLFCLMKMAKKKEFTSEIDPHAEIPDGGKRDGHIEHVDYEKPEGEDQVTGNVNDDVLAYVNKRGMVHEEAINLPYSAGHIHAAVTFLKGQGKLNGDGNRVW